ncbi:MAG: hypothetical protein AVO33_02115 [delta proteobacterium ML8_F1]|nr:MAG: hypothetical protein AVO33_02115 [delta proteobacterium ML8_F1]
MATLMIQGTASSVGKSMITAGLLRVMAQDGLRVAPFKAQNMSNNSFITLEGDEMGRAQVLQAQGAGLRPHARMNPLLIKPEGDMTAQLVVRGRVYGQYSASEYERLKPRFMELILEDLHTLEKTTDVVVIEGAGSPAEINLRKNDLVNMGLATRINSPVLLVGDIDRGGVFAALYGTLKLLDKREQELIKGTLINKFRGDRSLLDPGIRQIEALMKKDVLGVIPFFDLPLEEEDGMGNYPGAYTGGLDVAVIRLPHLSNLSDFDALKSEEGLSLRFVDALERLGQPDVLILPGTKNTLRDLRWLKKGGLYEGIMSLRETRIMGICGGYQILGEVVRDPDGIEGDIAMEEGLGLIPMETRMKPFKVTRQSRGVLTDDETVAVRGYEIHMGKSLFLKAPSPLLRLENGEEEGYQSSDKRIVGTYLHGIFDSPSFREGFFNPIRREKGLKAVKSRDYEALRETYLDQLASVIRTSLDMEKIYRIVEAG